jgi:hypothetical protein
MNSRDSKGSPIRVADASHSLKAFKKFSIPRRPLGSPSGRDPHLQRTVAVKGFAIPCEALAESSGDRVHLEKTVAVKKFAIPREAVGGLSNDHLHLQKTVAIKPCKPHSDAIAGSRGDAWGRSADVATGPTATSFEPGTRGLRHASSAGWRAVALGAAVWGRRVHVRPVPVHWASVAVAAAFLLCLAWFGIGRE